MAVERRKAVVLCPHCGKPVEWDAANPYRPFCTQRCKLMDLGKWAAEEYRIPEGSGAAPPRAADPD
jgi:endogenous inhibitor of DNA gyrase (YacG/DUF329 family)